MRLDMNEAAPQRPSEPALSREDGKSSGLSLSADQQGTKNSLPDLTYSRGASVLGEQTLRPGVVLSLSHRLSMAALPRAVRTSLLVSGGHRSARPQCKGKGLRLGSTPPRTPSRRSWPFTVASQNPFQPHCSGTPFRWLTWALPGDVH